MQIKTNGLKMSLLAVLLLGSGLFTSVQAADATTAADLNAAYSTISNSIFVDLTHSFSPSTPVWHGFGPETVSRAADPENSHVYNIKDDGFRSQVFTHVGQYGTHVDPPAHFYQEGKRLDEISTKEMVLPLKVIDVTSKLEKDPNYALTVEDIKSWEAKYSEIQKGSFVALRTDMSKDWESNPEHFKRYPFPGWSLEAVKFLVKERGVVAIGHESLDTDATETMESEVWLLEQNKWQIEVMANLDKVPATGSLIVATWPKPKNGLGFPARVFAIVPSSGT